MPSFRRARGAESSLEAGMMSAFALGARLVRRSGYGAMQLAGPYAFGPPPDRASAIGALQAAIAAGVDHIDSAQYYGPGVVNDLIREALHPYPDGLAIVSKVAVRRDDSGSVLPSDDPDQLREDIEDNLRRRRSRSSGCCNWPRTCSSSLGPDLSATCGRTWPPKASRSMTRRCANWTPWHHGQTIRLERYEAMTYLGRSEPAAAKAVKNRATMSHIALRRPADWASTPMAGGPARLAK